MKKTRRKYTSLGMIFIQRIDLSYVSLRDGFHILLGNSIFVKIICFILNGCHWTDWFRKFDCDNLNSILHWYRNVKCITGCYVPYYHFSITMWRGYSSVADSNTNLYLWNNCGHRLKNINNVYSMGTDVYESLKFV